MRYRRRILKAIDFIFISASELRSYKKGEISNACEYYTGVNNQTPKADGTDRSNNSALDLAAEVGAVHAQWLVFGHSPPLPNNTRYSSLRVDLSFTHEKFM